MKNQIDELKEALYFTKIEIKLWYQILVFMIVFRLLNRFGQYRYFRQIADFLKIKVPPLNQQILITNDRRCTIHGVKLIQKPPQIQQQSLSPQEAKLQRSTNEPKEAIQNQPLNLKQQKHIETYQYDQHSELILSFEDAISAAKQLSLDLCLIKGQSNGRNPVLSISAARRHIYEEYYKTHIKRKIKFGFKSIRLGQKINQHDLRNKYENVKRMFDEGQRNFKLLGLNDSEKSQKVIIEFAKLFGKSIEPYIQTTKSENKRKELERWVGNMIFDEPIAVNPEQVNKKWRRLKIQMQREVKRQEEEVGQFEHQDPQIQRDIYLAYKQMNKKLPARFQELAALEKEIQSDKMGLFKSASKAQSQPEFQWDDEEQRKYQANNNKLNNQFFGKRTIDDILTEMQQLKISGYQSQAYKVARFRELKSELESRIRSEKSNDL